MLKKYVGALAGLLFLLISCETLDPKVDIPHYFYVTPFEIDNSQADSAIYSSKITDVWVYVDGQLQGGYELPAILPVNLSGSHRVEMYPGIKRGGISNRRALYPFYEPINLGQRVLEGAKVDTIKAVTYYNDKPDPIIFAWYEGFEENLGLTVNENPFSDTSVTLITDPDQSFRGNNCGGLFLDEGSNFLEIWSPSLQNLPLGGLPIYLELDYKSNHAFIVGLLINNKTEQFPIYVVNPQQEWNKIYFEFGEYVANHTSAVDFNIFIGVQKDPKIKSQVRIYLDNIKLIHF